MKIEFDPLKDMANREKHGVPLAFGRAIFDDPRRLVIASIRHEDGEDRYKAIGMIDGKLWSAVHVYRGQVIRFLSVRRSNSGEQRAYDIDIG